MNYYLKVLQNYATFTGRARRSEYWYFVLFNLIFGIVAIILDNVLGIPMEGMGNYGPLYSLYSIVVLIPIIGTPEFLMYPTDSRKVPSPPKLIIKSIPDEKSR